MVEVIKPYFLTNGGSIIALQIENEYGSIVEYMGERGKKYIRWSAEMLQKLAPELPIFLSDNPYRQEPKDVDNVIRSCNGRAT
jgi:beta-galactosidase GanA